MALYRVDVHLSPEAASLRALPSPTTSHETEIVQDDNSVIVSMNAGPFTPQQTIADLKRHLATLPNLVLSPYLAEPERMPMCVVGRSSRRYVGDAPNGLLINVAQERFRMRPTDVVWFFVDLTNEGEIERAEICSLSAAEILSQTFESPHDLTETKTKSSTTLCQQGLLPSAVSRWSGFSNLVQSNRSRPATFPPHRTLFPNPKFDDLDICVSDEADVSAYILNTVFRSLNAIYRGAGVECRRRDRTLQTPIFGDPDLAISDGTKAMIVAEVKPESVIPPGTDLGDECSGPIRALNALNTDHRWLTLSTAQRESWLSIIEGSCVTRTIIQLYGYMCANRVRYGILTTATDWWFAERDEKGAMKIAGLYNLEDEHPTVTEAVNYLVSKSLESSEIEAPSEGPPIYVDTTISNRRLVDTPASTIDGEIFDVQDMSIRRCASGRSGEVFDVVVHHRRMALKTVDLFQRDREALDEFENELNIYRRLQHLQGSSLITIYTRFPKGVSIAKLAAYGMLLNSSIAALGTDWIPEARHLSGDDRHSFDAVRKIFAQIHAAGVRHNDVCPRNILVRSDGSIFVIDFGFATISDRAEDAAGEVRALESLLSSL